MPHDGNNPAADPIRLAGAAWSWVGATLRESAAIYRALGVGAIDLIAIPGSRFDPYEIAANPTEKARGMAHLEVSFSNLLVFFGANFHDHALNSFDAAVRAKNRDIFQRLLESCAVAGCNSITVLPGVDQPTISRDEALKYAAAELNVMDERARDAEILLVYEPHVQSILESPHDVLKFARENCNAKLVIDYSHAVSLGFPTTDLDPLVEYAGHVHLRQAAPGKIQARWEEGTIDFPALVSLLKRTRYQGYLTLEYEHDKFWEMDRCDVMTETIKMRDTVLRCLG